MAAKIITLYKVYIHTQYENDCGVSEYEHFVGEAWGVSEKQAINNARYRVFGKMPKSNCVMMPCDGATRWWFTAEKVRSKVVW